jgi:hypothetical protein
LASRDQKEPPVPKTFSVGVAVVCVAAVAHFGIAAAVAAPRAGHPLPPHVPARQAAAFPVLRGPVAKDIPPFIAKSVARRPGIMRKITPYPTLARHITAPGAAQPHDWYLIPGRGGMCLYSKAGGTCVFDFEALAGRLVLQLIKPVGHDPRTPFPPAGTPITSKIFGVLPAGITAITATTAAGATLTGSVSADMYTIAGPDIRALHLIGPSFEVPVGAPPQL